LAVESTGEAFPNYNLQFAVFYLLGCAGLGYW